MSLSEEVLGGKPIAVARLINLVENRAPEALEEMQNLYPECGRAQLIGITGPPGSGKSCLTAALTRQCRKKGMSVGVLAVDPSSPFTGGAVLGDRERMTEFNNDPEVFIRSLATRGAPGGLSEAVNGAADILDASGKDIIFIETVGVGQNEVDIVKLSQTVILVLVPGYGDWLQALKAGILEIADVIAVNKADLSGADITTNEMCSMRSAIAAEEILKDPERPLENWQIPVIQTSTTKETGCNDLLSLMSLHFKFLKEHGQLPTKNRQRRLNQFLNILTRQIREEFLLHLQNDSALQRWVKKIEELEIDPYQASSQIINFIIKAREEAKSAIK